MVQLGTYSKQVVQSQRVLMVCTSAAKLGDTDQPTGVWLEEVAAPYYLFIRKGYHVDFCSVKGGKIPVDPSSLQGPWLTVAVKKFMADVGAQAKMANSRSIVYTPASDYDAIFVCGGYGITWDGAFNRELKRLLEDSLIGGRVVAAVGHGPCSMVTLTDRQGRPYIAGKQVTGMSTSEEELLGKAALVPFLLENKLRQLGAYYVRTPVDFSPFAIRSGNIITGQNSHSALLTASLTIEALSMGVRLTV